MSAAIFNVLDFELLSEQRLAAAGLILSGAKWRDWQQPCLLLCVVGLNHSQVHEWKPPSLGGDCGLAGPAEPATPGGGAAPGDSQGDFPPVKSRGLMSLGEDSKMCVW